MKRPTVILIMVTSIDGYSTKHVDGLVAVEDKEHFTDLTQKIGVIIYGQKTYTTLNKTLPGRLNIVRTKTPGKFKNQEQLEFTNKSPKKILEDLSQRGFKQVALVGGAETNTAFLEDGLIDELYLTIDPHLFGSGKRLFDKIKIEKKLTLLESKMLNDNTILLHYKF